MWIFSEDRNYPQLLTSLGIEFEVYKGVVQGAHIPAYHIADDTPQEKIEQLKVAEKNRGC